MNSIEEIIQAAMSAPSERREQALRLLQGKLPKPEPYLTLRELSRKTGFGVTTLRRWRIPGHDLGGVIRYQLSDVDKYLKSQGFRRHKAALRADRRKSREDCASNQGPASPTKSERNPDGSGLD